MLIYAGVILMQKQLYVIDFVMFLLLTLNYTQLRFKNVHKKLIAVE